LHTAWPGEFGLALNDSNAQPLEALDRVVRREALDHPRDTGADRGEIDRRRRIVDAEFRTVPPGLRQLGRRQQRFRRHAAEIEAVTAHRAALNEDHVRPHLRRPGGDREPTGAAADHAQIGGERVLCKRLAHCARSWPHRETLLLDAPSVGRLAQRARPGTP
jgi:hypothetical protein